MREKLQNINDQQRRTSDSKGASKGATLLNYEKMGVTIGNNKDLSKECVWLRVQEGATLLNVSKRTMQRKLKSGNYKTKTVWANGGEQYRISLSSLPVEAQNKYLMSVAEKERSKKRTSRELKEWQEETALARYNLIKEYMDFLLESRMKSKLKAKKKFVKVYNKEAFPYIYKVLEDVSYKTLERWKKRLIESDFDYRVLAPRYGKNTGRRGLQKFHKDVLIRLYLSPNAPKVSEVIREARNVFEIKGNYCSASDRTMRRFINDFKKNNYDQATLMRQGQKALNDKVSYYIERDVSQLEVGDVLVADGHVMNFDVKHPVTGRPVRPTWLVVYDMRTNIPIGWEIMPTENTRCIASAYRHAILNLGFVPRVFYLDNGKAFRAKYFTESDDLSMLSGLFERLGCEVINAWPYHGQSKPVERFFGTFGEFERKMITYRGYNIENKPARWKRGERLHRKWYKNLSERTPTIEDVEHMLSEWIYSYIDRESTKNSHLNGRKPVEVFNESMARVRQQQDFQDRLVEKGELNYLMLSSEEKSLYRNGIRHMGRYYYADELYRFSKESGNRAKFHIRYDIHNMDYVLVFKNNKFVCRAEATEKAHPAASILGNDQDREQLQQQIERKRRLEKSTIQSAEKYIQESPDVQFVEDDIAEEKEEEKGLPERQKRDPGLKLVADGEDVEEKEQDSGLKLVDDEDFDQEQDEDIWSKGLKLEDEGEDDKIYHFRADKKADKNQN